MIRPTPSIRDGPAYASLSEGGGTARSPASAVTEGVPTVCTQPLPLPLGEVPQCRNTGAERGDPLSHRRKRRRQLPHRGSQAQTVTPCKIKRININERKHER